MMLAGRASSPTLELEVARPRHATAKSHARPQAVIAIAFAIVLLVLATTQQGAFATSRWAPLALFSLAVLIGAVVARGGLALRSAPIRVALTGIWGLAVWSMLSMTWAQSSGDAFNGACEIVFYAAIATLPFALPLSRRAYAAAGWAGMTGIGVVAVYVLIRLLANGSSLFLAGRLNAPIDYRNATALLFAMPVWPFVIAAASRDYRRAVRASALSLAVLCMGLAFLTQSRGILIGLVVGGLVVLAAGPDRVRRIWIAALVIAAVGAASPWLLRPFHAFDGGSGYVSPHTITVAAIALVLITVGAFVVGMAVALFDQGLRIGSPEMRHAHTAARAALVLGAVVVVAAGAVAIGNPVSF